MDTIRSEAFYADVRGGRRFCLVHRPELATPRGTVVHIHAFAGEMNRSRRTVALAARALARQGWAVLLIDLAGCGDSSGEFGDATWSDWVEDALFAHRWASKRFAGPSWLWGLRAGCLVAAEAGSRLDGRPQLLLWQPVVSGQVHLTQFLRFKLANEALGTQGDDRTGTKALRARLANGEPLEVAGYTLNPRLAAGLEKAELRLENQRARIVLREVSAEPDPALAPATAARVAALESRGIPIDGAAVTGPLFWHTVETEECPALVEATVMALETADVVDV